MNRRSFMAVLASLPFVGKLFPQGQSFEADASRYLKPWPKANPYRYEPKTTLPEVKWRPVRGGELDQLMLFCLVCGQTTTIMFPVELERTGILKTGKHICDDCKEDVIWRDKPGSVLVSSRLPREN